MMKTVSMWRKEMTKSYKTNNFTGSLFCNYFDQDGTDLLLGSGKSQPPAARKRGTKGSDLNKFQWNCSRGSLRTSDRSPGHLTNEIIFDDFDSHLAEGEESLNRLNGR